MRLLCILLVLANVGYLAWQFNERLYGVDGEGGFANVGAAPPAPLAAGSAPLKLLTELEQLPRERDAVTAEFFSGEPAEDILSESSEDDTASNEVPMEAIDATPEVITEVVEQQLPMHIEYKSPEPVAAEDERVTAVDAEHAEPEGTGPVALDETVLDSPDLDEIHASQHCYSFGPFENEQVLMERRLVLDNKTDWLRTEVRKTTRRKFYWVYLQPTDTGEDAEQQVSELVDSGITDYMLIQRGGLKNAISLGLFSSQDSVNRRLAELSQEGYRPVVVPRYEFDRIYWLHAGGSNPDLLDIVMREAGFDFTGKIADCAKIALTFAAQ